MNEPFNQYMRMKKKTGKKKRLKTNILLSIN